MREALFSIPRNRYILLGLQIYNRTTMQHSTLTTNGHTSPTERVRYMDTFMASGGRDATVKIWAI